VNRRRGLLVGGAIVAVLLVILALSNPTEDRYDRPPLDPRGTGPQGTAALVELLREEGADVRIGLPDDRDDVVLLLSDTLGGDPAEELRAWVDDGGTLVVTDPFSAASAPEGPIVGEVSRPADCDVAALRDLIAVEPALPTAFDVPAGASACFSAEGQSAGVVVEEDGFGLTVSVASPEPFTNERLGQVDNAPFAVRLLVPYTGARVRIIDPNRFYGSTDDVGDGTVLGALPRRMRDTFAQLVVAFLAWGLIRGRRLGKPVDEELPVPLPASDLVLASGRLLDRNGDASDAAERLRRRVRRDLGVVMGLGSDPPPVELAHALHQRGGIDTDVITAALLAPVVDEADLVATSAHLDRLRAALHPTDARSLPRTEPQP
jgi:hypothetical protein